MFFQDFFVFNVAEFYELPRVRVSCPLKEVKILVFLVRVVGEQREVPFQENP